MKIHWIRFKQEWIAIVCLSLIQIWWWFNFPAILRLTPPWNTLLALGASFVSVLVIVLLYLSMDKFAPYLKLKHIDLSPYPSQSKKNNIIVQVVLAVCSMFFVWYTNVYNMSDMYYILLYVTWFLTFMIVYSSVSRSW